MANPGLDEEAVQRSLSLLFQGSKAAELRVLRENGEMHMGRFSSSKGIVQALRTEEFKAAYVVLNRLKPECAAEAQLGRTSQMARDGDIESRQWLLVDVDAKRPSGTNSTDQQHEAALKLARVIQGSMRLQGWPEPILADSGNGAHLLYRLPDLPNTQESKSLVNNALSELDERWSRNGIQIDRTVGNAARISKLYGTVTRKGEHTEERPQRMSAVLSAPPRIEPVLVERLRTLGVGQQSKEVVVTPYSAPLAAKGFRMQDFIDRYGIRTRPPQDYNADGKRWQMDCPFDKTHKAPDAALFEYGDGAKAFKCSHDSCSHQNWQSFRAQFEGPRIERPARQVAGLEYSR